MEYLSLEFKLLYWCPIETFPKIETSIMETLYCVAAKKHKFCLCIKDCLVTESCVYVLPREWDLQKLFHLCHR